MEQRRVRQLWVSLLAVLALVAVAAFWIFLPPRIRWRRVEDAIRQSETAPSQAAADRLVILLNQGSPTPEQGGRVLASLFRPRVTTRRTYPASRPPTVALQLPFPIRRLGEGFIVEGSLCADGKPTEIDFYASGTYLKRAYCIATLDHPLQGGQVCEAEIRCHIRYITPAQYDLLGRKPMVQGIVRNIVAPFNRKLAAGIGSPKRKKYECDLVVPVSLVAAEGGEGKVDLVSNPQLDMSLRSNFVSHPDESMGRGYSTNAGLLSCDGGAMITYPELPLAVAFKAVLRLPEGRELHQCGEPIEPLRARAGDFGQFYINIADFVAPEAVGARAPWIPGEYTGTLLLRPDPNLAYDDPAIDAIWDGTLEFPIRFTVTAESKNSNRE